MSLRKTALNPFIRWLGAVTLITFIGAQILCQTHCLGACEDEASEGTSDASAVTASHHDDDQDASQPGHHHDSHGDSPCLTLKSVLTGNKSVAVFTPRFLLVYFLPPLIPMSDTVIVPVEPSFRQAGRCDWVFTPEVSLGPAFRSHAPPYSSVA